MGKRLFFVCQNSSQNQNVIIRAVEGFRDGFDFGFGFVFQFQKKPRVSGCALAVARASESERLVVKIMSDEIDAELQRQIEIWQRDEAENEAARLEAEACEARELDEFLERLLNAPSDL